VHHFIFCPVCDGPVAAGSHWDCVFTVLADWAIHKEEKGEPAAGAAVSTEGEVKNG
jgi:hypothetical protein